MEMPLFEDQIVELPKPDRLWPPDNRPMLDVDNGSQNANQIGVANIPMTTVFQNGKPVGRITETVLAHQFSESWGKLLRRSW